jgi:hypothetical protein
MPSPTDFNLSPYYDDFDKSKGYHRILFRPAFAVQARELTQSQTILQNQVENLSDHLFEKGAMVIPGEVGYDLQYGAVKLSAKSLSTLSSYNGVKLTGATSGVEALVVNYTDTTGTDPDTLYVKYTKTGTDNSTLKFTDGETVNCTVDSVSQSVTVDTTETGSAASVEAGVYYINGFQVDVSQQTIILDKYTNSPSYRVGLDVSESFTTSNDDLSLNDNAQGSSNQNAPGAHRFKINLTLKKLAIGSAEDSNFIELLRLKNGAVQNQVRSSEYAVLEDTFARRTFDESGSYVVRGFDIDLREHLIDGNNRGIYTSGNGGDESKIAAGLNPGKAYVKGYEIARLGTSYVEVDKARDYETQNNFKTSYDVSNFSYVNNMYSTPDVGYVPGDTEAFKSLTLYSEGTSVRGSANTGQGHSTNKIGYAKSRGMEYVDSSSVSAIMSQANYAKHFLFDIEMFSHASVINATGSGGFGTGETITGSQSGATATVQSGTTQFSANSIAMGIGSPGEVTFGSDHNLRDGTQVVMSNDASGEMFIDSTLASVPRTFTIRKKLGDTTTIELYDVDGTTPINMTGHNNNTDLKFTATHLILGNVKGEFKAGETITGGTTGLTGSLQPDVIGQRAVRSYDFSNVKQITMSGSPTYTADTAINSAYGEVVNLTGTMSIANSGSIITGFGTRWTEELKNGDSIVFVTDAGTTKYAKVATVDNDNQIQLTEVVGAADVSTKTILIRQRSKLQGADKNISIFKMPTEAIKTLKTTQNLGITDTNFTVRRNFTGTLSSTGEIAISAGTNETFAGASNRDFVVSIIQQAATIKGQLGDVLKVEGNNHAGNPIFTLGGSPTGKTLTLDFGNDFNGHKVKILATVNRGIASSKSKTLHTGETIALDSQVALESGTIGLGKADVYKINNIYMSADFSTPATTSDTDVTNRYNLDTGQRDNWYDIGRIKQKTGAITATGRLLVNFQYFSHGSGDYIDVDSYDGVIDYKDVPTYTSDTSGVEFKLRDCIDFRPRVDDASSINIGSSPDRSYDGSGASTVDVLKFQSNLTSDFEYYLPRIDKLFLDKDGNFRIAKGASSLNPQQPKSVDGAMHLYTMNIPAYTIDTAGINIEKIDNRRYTMRDIGKLENRIENLEYYTQLSLLETAAQNLQIQDSAGFDRFKNGFIVDNFTGHQVGDVGNVDYKCSMDMELGEVRPMFNEDAVQLIERDDDGTAILDSDRTSASYRKTGDLLTLPYSEISIIDQPFASKTLNVNPFNIFSWIGSIELTPATDEWKETERTPELVINNIGAFDTMVQGGGNIETEFNSTGRVEIGTVWNEWANSWSGTNQTTSSSTAGNTVTTATTTTTNTGQTRQGIRNAIIPQTVRNSIGDRIVNVAFVPFVRSRTISFAATQMKPNTRVFPYFDNIDVSAYVTPDGGVLGGNCVTDAAGAVNGTFAIPDPTDNSNPRWRTGERVFRLTSSASDSRQDVETAGEVDYVARGLLETVQNTIISTREPRLIRSSVTAERVLTNSNTTVSQQTVQPQGGGGQNWGDPLAQTFLVDDEGGMFLTSMDLYFKSKDDNIPVTIQIREVVNGYPGQTVLPFSEVTLNPSSVNITDDASTKTTFTFPSPVYIQSNTEYCFVIMANSNKYNCYVARLGENVIGSNRTISQQPYAGVLFKSQNASTWTAEQNEDIKFSIKRAEFENVTGTVTMVNDTLPSRALVNNPIRTTEASGVVRVFHPNHGMHSIDNNVTISGVPVGTHNGIDAAYFNRTHTTISNITLDSYDILLEDSSTATVSGDIGGNVVVSTQNRLMDTGYLSIQTLEVPGTGISYKIRPTTGKAIHGSQTEFSLTSNANAIPVVANDNIFFTSPYMVSSEINETNEMTGTKSFWVSAVMSTNNTKVSPVIDTQRISLFTIQNRLNKPTSGNTPDFVADGTNTGSSTACQYITKPVTLDNPATALDIRLTSNIRSESNVYVYYKITSSAEIRNIGELGWLPFNGDGSEDTAVIPAEDGSTYKEYKYSASALSEFSAFQIKIVMKGENSAYPPKVRDMRGIALAV